MLIREAKQEDCKEIFDWWNDPLTRKMMYDTADVEWDVHQEWFNKITADEDVLLCLGCDNDGKVGVVRFDRKSELSFEVSINLNPDRRGEKLASIILAKSEEFFEHIHGEKYIFAKVRVENIASKKSFLKAGYIYNQAPPLDINGMQNFMLGEQIFLEKNKGVMDNKNTLAIFGGKKVRSDPMPLRRALGSEELEMVNEVTSHYVSTGEDLPYLGIYNTQFSERFVEFMGCEGFASPVTSGTAAVYIALAALDLPKGSKVLVSPVTDSGPIAALLNLDLIPIIVDAEYGSWNISLNTFKNSDLRNSAALLLTHAGGEPTKDTKEIVKLAQSYGLLVVEDAAQAPGAKISGRCVGTFGDISAFSTMYRKSIISGSQGGLVYTRCPELGRRVLAHVDKGKPIWRKDLDLRDPNYCLFPGLNWMQDEISCGIGIASLDKLSDVVSKRYKWTKKFIDRLLMESKVCKPYNLNEGFSVFFFSIFVDCSIISCDKTTFAKAVQAEGIGLGEHYGCVVSSWDWLHKILGFTQSSPNAEYIRDNSFNLYVNEKYGDLEINEIVEAIVKVENHYLK